MPTPSENYTPLAQQLQKLLVKTMLLIAILILIIGTFSYQTNATEYFKTHQATLQETLHLHQSEILQAWQQQKKIKNLNWLKPYLLPHSQLILQSQDQPPMSIHSSDFKLSVNHTMAQKIHLSTAHLQLNSQTTLLLKQLTYFPVSYFKFITRPIMAITATALILWFILGRWIHRIQQRLSKLSDAMVAYQTRPYTETEETLSQLTLIQPRDDISRLAETSLEMLRQIQKTAEKLEQLALYDKLTQLPNRQLLEDRFKLIQAYCTRTGTQMALVLFDLDHFKQINDTHGHQMGDKILKQVSSLVTQQLRDSDTLARWGGDEFIILLPNLKRCQEAHTVLTKIQNYLQQPQKIDQTEIPCTLSMGISCFPQDGYTLDELIHAADQALYQAKESGRNQYAFSKPA